MDKERREGIVVLAAVSALSACFVFSANIYQEQFAHEVCLKALFVYGDNYRVQMERLDLNARKCEIAIDEVNKHTLPRWLIGLIFSSLIVAGTHKLGKK